MAKKKALSFFLQLLLTHRSSAFSICNRKQCSFSTFDKRLTLQASPEQKTVDTANDDKNDDFWEQQKALAASFSEKSDQQERKFKK